MRLNVLIVLMIFFGLRMGAQEMRTITGDNHVVDTYMGVLIEMPDYREVYSGTKILVNYEGDWAEDMKGAFEYAVKIWEEVLPLSLPIRIDAKIGSFRGESDLLSKVTFDTYEFLEEPSDKYAAPLSMIKSVILQEHQASQQIRFGGEIEDLSFLEGTDMTITYNGSKLSQCSFNLDGDLSESKYDFVTVALRDIAIGLGFTTSFTADKVDKTINFTGERLTPFEELVLLAMGSEDPKEAYIKATKGSLKLPVRFGLNPHEFSIYAPSDWENGVSLRWMIPDNHPLSKLLTNEFGKGYILRDLSQGAWKTQFANLLDWRIEILSGGGGYSVTESGTSKDIIPYN